jgi:hypothetical protein
VTTHVFLSGANATLSAIAGLFFLRYAVITRDRFFVLWTFSFWLLAVNWGIVGAVAPSAEGRHYAYLVRLAAFLLIIIAIVDKNRTRPR